MRLIARARQGDFTGSDRSGREHDPGYEGEPHDEGSICQLCGDSRGFADTDCGFVVNGPPGGANGGEKLPPPWPPPWGGENREGAPTSAEDSEHRRDQGGAG